MSSVGSSSGGGFKQPKPSRRSAAPSIRPCRMRRSAPEEEEPDPMPPPKEVSGKRRRGAKAEEPATPIEDCDSLKFPGPLEEGVMPLATPCDICLRPFQQVELFLIKQ